jgi:hypothetical protein
MASDNDIKGIGCGLIFIVSLLCTQFINQAIGTFFLICGVIYFIKCIAAGVEEDKAKWHGNMVCDACGYRWRSRRPYPPAKCPSCSGTNISPVAGF